MDFVYLIVAYGLVWLFFFLYLLGIARRLRAVTNRLSAIEERLDFDDAMEDAQRTASAKPHRSPAPDDPI